MRISYSSLALAAVCSVLTGVAVYLIQQQRVDLLEQKVELLGEMVPIPSLPTANSPGGN